MLNQVICKRMVKTTIRYSARPEDPSSAGGHVRGQDVVEMAVEVFAGSAVAHGGSRVSVEGGDLYVVQVDTSVEHPGDEGASEHVGVHSRQLDTCLFGEASQSLGSAVPVHPVP
jgi:hypothetical protein